MQPKHWLDALLTRHNLSFPDQRQLYQYRVTDAEFESLKDTIKLATSLGLVEVSKVLPRWDAVFVIYAAEWWRREYDGHSWSWKEIFESFEANTQELNALQRNHIVKNGLQYWQRKVRVINGNSRYLGTIAIEGGLPLNQLNNANGGWLGAVLKQAIPKYIRLQASGVNASEIISEYECIPQNYQNEQIYLILGDMLQTVVALKKQYQLPENNPVEYLNINCPSWREQFPLPVDNTTGSKLLSDMVKVAAKTDQISVLPFRSIRYLDGNFKLKINFEFAKFINLNSIFPQTALENIPSRLEVELLSNESEVIKLGYALKTTYKGSPSLKIPFLSYSLSNENLAIKGYLIRFKHLSEVINPINPLICEEIDSDLPWTFVLKEEQWQLEGTGSIRTKAKEVRILFPVDLSCNSDNQIKEIFNTEHKKLIESIGIIKLTDGENNFTIKTAQIQETERYYLEGEKLSFESNPKELYLGLPKLWAINNETGICKQVYETLVTRPVKSKENWIPLTNNKQGIYEIRLQDKDGIQFRKICALLPENFAIFLKPELNSLNGSIYLENIGNARISCGSEINGIIEATDSNSYKIECQAENSPPAYIPVILSWVGMTEIVELKIPFPVRGGQLIDPDGCIIPSNQTKLFQDKLHGFRLRLISENANRNLQIEFNLRNTELNNQDLYFRDDIKRKGTIIELSIIDYIEWIKSLFSLSELDSYVKLAVYEHGQELLCVKVFRYQFSLERNRLEGSVFLNYEDHAKLSFDEISKIQLMAMRLSQPEQEHIALEPKFTEQTETGSWFFYPEKRVAEPWLIYPSFDSSICLRPILWIGTNEQETLNLAPLQISTLHSAVTLSNTELRRLVISKILLKICVDFEHSGWEYLQNLWQKCSHLPLSSFDVWSLIVTQPKVLVALTLKMDETFICKLNQELPVFWELIPLSYWLAVFSQYKNYLQQAIIDEADVKSLLEIRINRITNLSASMEIVAQILKHTLCCISDQELNFMSLPVALSTVIANIKETQHELDRRQADSQWPILLQSEIIRNWDILIQPQQQLLNLETEPKHHYSVILLPVLLAIFCVKNEQKLVNDAAHVFKLKQLKAFDEDWFNIVFRFSLAYLSQQPEHKNKLIKDAYNMININDEDITQFDKEIEGLTNELAELKTNTDGLKNDLNQFKDINEELELLRMENEELKERLAATENQHTEFVASFKEFMKKRDDAIKFLLQEVKELNGKMNEMRSSLGNKNN